MNERTRFSISIVIFQLVLALTALPDRAAGAIDDQLTTVEKQQLQREARLVVDLLQNHHYSGRSFREIENKDMIARYLTELDPQADLFSADSVALIHRRFDRTFKSVYLFRGDLQPAFEIFDQFIAQARERLAWVQLRLDRNFDFSLEENYVDVENPTPHKTKQDADRHWELLLKEWTIEELLRGRKPDDAIAEVKRRFVEIDRTIASYDSLAVREHFFDAVIRSYDPHSGYFSADSSREFALEMEKAVVGLGLDLRKEKGRCVVTSVQTGGAADLNSGIAPGDVIVALAEDDAPWIDLASLRLREIVNLMRGKEGAKLRIAYQPGGTEPRVETTLERTRIVLGSDRAHGAVSEVPSPTHPPRRIGWIDLPSFYAAGEGSSVSSVAQDVRELLTQMSTAPLDGLVIDLRDNPGGALNEAAALSELFLPRGDMMLSRGVDGKLKEHPLREGKPLYLGPLVVLISSSSASASEVFAGAMKYHQRALIVGSSSTFGKGTMQNYIELTKMQNNPANDWGTLRLTVERFYLPDGQSVQRTGIPSHITFPAFESSESNRHEADLPGALPVEIVPAPPGIAPSAIGNGLITAQLLARLNETASRNFTELPEWKLIGDEQKLVKEHNPHEARSLVLEQRMNEWTKQQSALNEVRRNRRALSASAHYPTVAYEINAVQAALQRHETMLRAVTNPVASTVPRLRQGTFRVETTQGRLRKLPLDAINFLNFCGETAALATAFSAGSGYATQAADVEIFLRQIALLEHKTDKNILAAASQISGGTLDPEAARRGTESLLLRLAEIDGDLVSDRPALDVPLRESLRLAAEWAACVEPAHQP